jgi:Xaa-Pro aminopeptidase
LCSTLFAMRIARPASLFLLLLLGISSTTLLALERQPNAIYQARREALARELHSGVAVLFGNYEPALEYQDFRQDEDFYYLTGWNEPGAALIVADAVPARAGKPALPYREILLLPERNLRMELFTGIKFDAASPNATGITGVREVRSIRELPGILSERGLHAVWTQLDSEPAKAALAFTQSTPLRTFANSPKHSALLKMLAKSTCCARPQTPPSRHRKQRFSPSIPASMSARSPA